MALFAERSTDIVVHAIEALERTLPEGVEAFFDNLLPDNRQIRERIQQRFRTPSVGAFDLLQEIGRDCVGALQLLPAGIQPETVKKITGRRLTNNGVAQLLTRALEPTSGKDGLAEDDFRISLAGAQEKTALLLLDGVWHQPTHATPTHPYSQTSNRDRAAGD